MRRIAEKNDSGALRGRVALNFGRHVRTLGSAYICRQYVPPWFALLRCRQFSRSRVLGLLDNDAAGAGELGRLSEIGVR